MATALTPSFVLCCTNVPLHQWEEIEVDMDRNSRLRTFYQAELTRSRQLKEELRRERRKSIAAQVGTFRKMSTVVHSNDGDGVPVELPAYKPRSTRSPLFSHMEKVTVCTSGTPLGKKAAASTSRLTISQERRTMRYSTIDEASGTSGFSPSPPPVHIGASMTKRRAPPSAPSLTRHENSDLVVQKNDNQTYRSVASRKSVDSRGSTVKVPSNIPTETDIQLRSQRLSPRAIPGDHHTLSPLSSEISTKRTRASTTSRAFSPASHMELGMTEASAGGGSRRLGKTSTGSRLDMLSPRSSELKLATAPSLRLQFSRRISSRMSEIEPPMLGHCGEMRSNAVTVPHALSKPRTRGCGLIITPRSNPVPLPKPELYIEIINKFAAEEMKSQLKQFGEMVTSVGVAVSYHALSGKRRSGKIKLSSALQSLEMSQSDNIAPVTSSIHQVKSVYDWNDVLRSYKFHGYLVQSKLGEMSQAERAQLLVIELEHEDGFLKRFWLTTESRDLLTILIRMALLARDGGNYSSV